MTPGTGKIRSYDLDGQLLWELGGMSSITIPTPFAAHGLLYVTSGYVMDRRKPLFAIRPGATGDISLEADQTGNEYVAWCQPEGGSLQPVTDRVRRLPVRSVRQVACWPATTLRPAKKCTASGGSGPERSAFTASPWAYDGKIFCLSEDGDTFVIQAGPEFQLSRQEQPGRTVYGHAGDRRRRPDHSYRVPPRTDQVDAILHCANRNASIDSRFAVLIVGLSRFEFVREIRISRICLGRRPWIVKFH